MYISSIVPSKQKRSSRWLRKLYNMVLQPQATGTSFPPQIAVCFSERPRKVIPTYPFLCFLGYFFSSHFCIHWSIKLEEGLTLEILAQMKQVEQNLHACPHPQMGSGWGLRKVQIFALFSLFLKKHNSLLFRISFPKELRPSHGNSN